MPKTDKSSVEQTSITSKTVDRADMVTEKGLKPGVIKALVDLKVDVAKGIPVDISLDKLKEMQQQTSDPRYRASNVFVIFVQRLFNYLNTNDQNEDWHDFVGGENLVLDSIWMSKKLTYKAALAFQRKINEIYGLNVDEDGIIGMQTIVSLIAVCDPSITNVVKYYKTSMLNYELRKNNTQDVSELFIPAETYLYMCLSDLENQDLQQCLGLESVTKIQNLLTTCSDHPEFKMYTPSKLVETVPREGLDPIDSIDFEGGETDTNLIFIKSALTSLIDIRGKVSDTTDDYAFTYLDDLIVTVKDYALQYASKQKGNNVSNLIDSLEA